MIVSSIDDTMVHWEPRIPLYIIHLNKNLKEAGIILSYFTGKMPYNFHALREDVGVESDVIYAHGGFTADGTIDHSFDAAPLKDMVFDAVQHGISVSIQFGSREVKLCKGSCGEAADPEFWKGPVYRIRFENPVPDGVLCDLERAYASLSSNYRVYRSKLSSMEIVSSDNNKEVAIKELVKKYGLTPDEVLVIGASEHDVPAFEWAKNSVAVGNAHYKLKAKASHVASRDYDSGYIEAIKIYFPEIVAASKVQSNKVTDWCE